MRLKLAAAAAAAWTTAAANSVPPGEHSLSAVLSSQWCRCKYTASLAFGRVTEWTALNSTFDQSAKQPAQTSQLRERLRQIKPGQFEVWLTHQVNMTALTREYPAMGEAFVVDGAARLASRMAFG